MPADPAARASRAAQTLRDKGYEPQSYSGRGMFGRYCLAIVVDYADETKRQLRGTSLARPSIDSMGRQHVLYWPHIAPPPDEG